MKRIFMLCAGLCALMTGFAQNDSTAKKQEQDTLKIGGMVIIREAGREHQPQREIEINHRPHRPGRSGITTNWLVLDFGFSNYVDDTKYGTPAVNAITGPLSSEDWFKLRTISSVNFDLWIFMQRISLIKRVVNFKYGLGFEFNNYRLDDKQVRINKNPFGVDHSYPSTLKKNKLGASYITMPFMLNFNFTPKKQHRSYGVSGGISVGYLYRAYQKVKEGNDKEKTKGLDFDTWKISYVGEVSLGLIHLYGSYAMESLFTNKNLNMTPYTVGLRFSNW